MTRSQRNLRGHIGFLALLAAAGGAEAAPAALPPFQIDPALLGISPTPAAAEVQPAQDTAPAAESSTSSGAPQGVSPAPEGSATAPTVTPVPRVAAPEKAPAAEPAPAAAAPGAKKAAAGEKQPVYIVADKIDGTTSIETTAQGNVDVQTGDRRVKSDQLIYREGSNEVEATGNVVLTAPGETMTGPHLKLKLDENVGSFDSPSYSTNRINSEDPNATAHGKAARLDFEGTDRYRMHNATYTTCPISSKDPDWFARVSDLKLDYTTSRGTARNATVVFKDLPILYFPWLSFTLDNQRKTGMLAPSIGSTSKSGFEVTAPFYWNIAPEMDATIAPRYMAKRGVQLGGEFRYLGQSYTGQIAGEYLKDDLTHTDRNALTIIHNQNFGNGFTGSLNINKVSDDTYFTDLSTRLSNITQTNLVREGRLNYGGEWWSASVMAQRYQTLQDPSQSLIPEPYDRLPQFLVNAARPDLPLGLQADFNGEYVAFEHPSGTQVEGKRTTLYPQLSYPMQTAAFFLTPKIGFHSTQYQLQQQAPGVPDHISRDVPIFSIDSGVVFERPLQWFSQEFTQTLEPRAYYLRVPARDQSQIPIFDTGIADFNFAQIFSENYYVGGDRISDANQLTVAATSRIIDTASGEELLRGALGQRFYFADQTVTLPGTAPRTAHVADLIAALSGRINRELSVDTGVQYNNQDHEVERLNIGGRYSPETGKIFNAGYRYTRALLRQIDASAQWPIWGGWHAVGRYNYSFRDKRAVETIAGLEYDGGCWAARFVAQRIATAVGQTNNSIFLQLELNGFSDIGSNPLDLLKRSIPGYGRITQTSAGPVETGGGIGY